MSFELSLILRFLHGNERKIFKKCSERCQKGEKFLYSTIEFS